MSADILTVIWKEWRELIFQRGSLRTMMLSLLLPVALIGIILPLQIGAVWVKSSLSLLLWVWLPLIPTMGITADAFAGERERHTLETLLASPLSDRAILFGKIAAVVAYAWLFALVILLIGLVSVNFGYGNGRLLFYSPNICLTGALIGILISTFYASIGVLVSLKAATVRQAQQYLGFVTLAISWLPILGFSFLPMELKIYLVEKLKYTNTTSIVLIFASFLAIIDLVLLEMAMTRFQRSRLILD